MSMAFRSVPSISPHRTVPRRRLSGVGEVDEAFVGGKPEFRHEVKNKPGRETGQPIALVATARNGKARAVLESNAQVRTIKPIMEDCIDPASVLITDKNSSYRKTGTSFANHLTVQHEGTSMPTTRPARLSTPPKPSTRSSSRPCLVCIIAWEGRTFSVICTRLSGGGTTGSQRSRLRSGSLRLLSHQSRPRLYRADPFRRQNAHRLCEAVGREMGRTL